MSPERNDDQVAPPEVERVPVGVSHCVSGRWAEEERRNPVRHSQTAMAGTDALRRQVPVPRDTLRQKGIIVLRVDHGEVVAVCEGDKEDCLSSLVSAPQGGAKWLIWHG